MIELFSLAAYSWCSDLRANAALSNHFAKHPTCRLLLAINVDGNIVVKLLYTVYVRSFVLRTGNDKVIV